ncbi:hypothetical protein ABEV41_00410 [Geobacillus thermodenitrificans]|uniref:hypothetical protein n=1 Tax=Geobacillus thermodenitrificans TaxID=33940 RepID=UPI003D2011A3
MKIVLKKIKRTNDYDRKMWRWNVKEGLKELREDYKSYWQAGYEIGVRGDKHTLTFITNDERAIKHILTVANNYAIPYEVRS